MLLTIHDRVSLAMSLLKILRECYFYKMFEIILDKIVDVITLGTRPFRILFFGGVFSALIIMNILAQVFDINTKLGGDINWPNIILMIVSMLSGFGLSYSVIHFASERKQKRKGPSG